MFYHIHNFEELGDLIRVGRPLTSLEQNLVQLSHIINRITDTYVLYGVTELM